MSALNDLIVAQHVWELEMGGRGKISSVRSLVACQCWGSRTQLSQLCDGRDKRWTCFKNIFRTLSSRLRSSPRARLGTLGRESLPSFPFSTSYTHTHTLEHTHGKTHPLWRFSCRASTASSQMIPPTHETAQTCLCYDVKVCVSVCVSVRVLMSLFL